jgi:hypothetical protein
VNDHPLTGHWLWLREQREHEREQTKTLPLSATVLSPGSAEVAANANIAAEQHVGAAAR